MKDSARFVKIVEWSDVDQCYVGSCPGLISGGCHGNDEQAVFAELVPKELRFGAEKNFVPREEKNG